MGLFILINCVLTHGFHFPHRILTGGPIITKGSEIPPEIKTAVRALCSCFNMDRARRTPQTGDDGEWGGAVITVDSNNRNNYQDMNIKF